MAETMVNSSTPDLVFDVVNTTLALAGVELAFIILIVTFQLRNRRIRMGWFLAAACITLGGLMFQIAEIETIDEDGAVYTIFSHILYAMAGPLFSLYFIETEREDGEVWDGKFWATVQFLVAILIGAFSIFGSNPFMMSVSFLTQYLIVLVMLFFSAKTLRACAGFILGLMFPITASLTNMADVRINVLGFGIILQLLVVFFGYQLDTDREIMRSKAELSEKKVSLLMEQIHPHFIYNSLQQITLLCDEDADQVKPAILNFSGYLRKKFQALTGESMIPFTEEMEHVDMYIELANILPSRHFEVERSFDVTEFMIPPLTLQPLVENAIQYGIGMSEAGDRIRIGSRRNRGWIEIYVEDDGHGKKTRLPSQKSYKSVGTDNVRARLKLLCNGELSVNTNENGTVAMIRIPALSGENAKKDQNSGK